LLSGQTKSDRLAAIDALALPPLLVAEPISAHRNLSGAYAAAEHLVRRIVPTALTRWPELVAAHEIELLSVAPDLTGQIPATHETLTSLAIPQERTRFYSRLRTLRHSHGLVDFIRDYLNLLGAGRLALVVDDLHAADPTDLEFLSVLIRRLDASSLTVVLATTPDHAQSLLHTPPEPLPAQAGDLSDAVSRYCISRSAEAAPDPDTATSDFDLARRFIDGDCVDDDPRYLRSLERLDPAMVAELHDRRADELVASGSERARYGPIPLHRERGSEPRSVGLDALAIAMDHAMLMGYYHSCLDFCERGRAMLDPERDPDLWWTFTAKMPTSLSILERGDEAAQLCELTRSQSQIPGLHIQFAYATAMLYTRHLQPEQRDNMRATAWINIAIALSSQVTDPRRRAFHSVFNHNGLALIEAHRGRPERALELVTSGLALLDEVLGPDEHLLHRSVLRYNRGQVLAGLGRVPEAIADYRAVIAADPNYPEYHFDLANLLHRLGEDEEALIEYETVMRLSPPFPEIYYNRGDLYVETGRWDEAIADFDRVLELDPRYLDAYINRAGLYAALGQHQLAADDVCTGLLLDPNNNLLLTLRAQLAIDKSDLEAARADIESVLRTDPDCPQAHAVLGVIEYQSGNLADAITAFDRSLEQEQDRTVLFNRGHAYQALLDWNKAQADFDRVLTIDPTDVDALLHRARCHLALGDDDAAANDVRRLLEHAPERKDEIEFDLIAAHTNSAAAATTSRP
jgi:tetratricopeptide (TPR) repeat protein